MAAETVELRVGAHVPAFRAMTADCAVPWEPRRSIRRCHASLSRRPGVRAGFHRSTPPLGAVTESALLSAMGKAEGAYNTS